MFVVFKDILKNLFPLRIILLIKINYYKFYKNRKIKNYYINSNINSNDLEDVGALWDNRIERVKKSSDNKRITRHKDAGKLIGNIITMHNGLKVYAKSFYHFGIVKLLIKNKGIHQPYKQYMFHKVLKEIPNGATIIELGTYWDFYSLWFAKEVKNAKCYLITPIYKHIILGKVNFKLNNMKSKFYQYCLGNGRSSQFNFIKSISVDQFLDQQNIKNVDVLYSDIQGGEVSMLHNSINSLKNKKIDYLFISTHSENIHKECENILRQFDYKILFSKKVSYTDYKAVFLAKKII